MSDISKTSQQVISTDTTVRTSLNSSLGALLVASSTADPVSGRTITNFQPLTVGADGTALVADSTQPTGVKWAVAPGSGTLVIANGGTGRTALASGSLLYGPASGTAMSALAVGSTGNVLTVAGGVPTWSAPAAAAAGSLTGTTLNSTVVTSSLTSVGVLAAPQVGSYAKASLPSATPAGKVIYVSDATGAHLTGSLAFSNGTNFIDVTTGQIVA